MSKIDEVVDEKAASILECLAEILPEVNDEGLLGEMILQKALEMYSFVRKVETEN